MPFTLFSKNKQARNDNFRKKSQKRFTNQSAGGEQQLRFRNPLKEEKTPNGKEYTGTFMPAYTFQKFEKYKEATNLYCSYSTTDYVKNKDVSRYNADNRNDTTTPIKRKVERSKLWSCRQIATEEVDVHKLILEAGLILEILEGKAGTKRDNAETGQGLFNHYRCHLINCKAVRKQEKEQRFKTDKNNFYFWKEGDISHIEIIAPTRLTTTGNETISMQLDKYLQSQGSKRIPEQQLVQFCYQICLGLKWFHENNLVYKDLRCRNVLVEKRGHNWLARIMAPGQGSLVKYVKDGYGWRNIKNSSVDSDGYSSRNYSNKLKEAGKELGPLENLTDFNMVLVSSRPLSKPPGKDRRGINLANDDAELERQKSLRRKESNKKIRRNSDPDPSKFNDFKKNFSNSNDKGLNSPTPSEAFSFTGSTTNLQNHVKSNESVNVNNENPKITVNENLVKNWHSIPFEERKLALNEQAVYWQPPEIHNAMMQKFNEHQTRREKIHKINPSNFDLNSKFNKLTDIYSLGATFWEIMTYGKVPFRDNLNFSFDVTLDAKKLIKGNVFSSQNYKLERCSWHQEHMHYLIQMCMNYEPESRPSLTMILDYYMLNVLSENGLNAKDCRCQCGRFIQKKDRKKFMFFNIPGI